MLENTMSQTRRVSVIRISNLFGVSTFVIRISVALATAGCMVGPDYHRSAPATMPASWSTQPPPTVTSTQPSTQSITSAAPVQIVSWWQAFDDPHLDSLVQRAFQSNLDLRQAEERIRQARAQRGVVASDFWPNANLNASYRRSYTGTAGFTNGIVYHTGPKPIPR